MEPFLRPAPPEGHPSSSCPPGYIAEPAGMWAGQWHEVVYDPRRHQVTFLRGNAPGSLEAALLSAGWEPQAINGDSQWWLRDRLAAARCRLAQAETPVSLSTRGLGHAMV